MLDEVKKGNHFYIEAMKEVEEDYHFDREGKHFFREVEIICGCPVSYGVSSSSDNGWGGCKERDAGHPPVLMAAAVYPQTCTHIFEIVPFPPSGPDRAQRQQSNLTTHQNVWLENHDRIIC